MKFDIADAEADEGVNYTNRIALADKVIQALGQQSRLPAIRPITKRSSRNYFDVHSS